MDTDIPALRAVIVAALFNILFIILMLRIVCQRFNSTADLEQQQAEAGCEGPPVQAPVLVVMPDNHVRLDPAFLPSCTNIWMLRLKPTSPLGESVLRSWSHMHMHHAQGVRCSCTRTSSASVGNFVPAAGACRLHLQRSWSAAMAATRVARQGVAEGRGMPWMQSSISSQQKAPLRQSRMRVLCGGICYHESCQPTRSCPWCTRHFCMCCWLSSQ